ncbi:MAG: nitronate monooxygenase [Acholeplasmataceae bacterium]
METQKLPEIIQGGMGIGVSSVKLARTVSMHGYLGVVSGTAVATTLARRLQILKGRRTYEDALRAFPYPKMANRILEKYQPSSHLEGLKNRFKQVEMPSVNQSDDLTELMVVANFVEVYLAKKGHQGLIGINLLEKIQLPTLASLYGAMLAGVDYVIMGAGIPKHIPSVLDQFAKGLEASLPIKVSGELDGETTSIHFDPVAFAKDERLVEAKRPKFLAIISSTTLALHLSRSTSGIPDGFIVEKPIAGGHNAPPRGQLSTTDEGEPIYTDKDVVDLEVLKKIGLPFWLAGGYGHHQAFLDAKASGAVGIQVGTAFALSKESGMSRSLKERIIDALKKGIAKVKTDLLASPTGFPFKVVNLKDTTGDEKIYQERKRICDIGYLREAYRKDNGDIGYRCPSEPVEAYVKKGGDISDTVGRKCLCNGLMSTIGFGQQKSDGTSEPPIITAGDDLLYLLDFLKPGEKLYSAIDVLKTIIGQPFKSLVHQ